MHHFAITLALLFLLSIALAHPWVSNPKRVANLDEFEVGDVYARFPKDQKPLHTTVLMAGGAQRPRQTATSPRGGEVEF